MQRNSLGSINTWMRVLFGIFCLGIIVTKFNMEKQFNSVSFFVLVIAAVELPIAITDCSHSQTAHTIAFKIAQ